MEGVGEDVQWLELRISHLLTPSLPKEWQQATETDEKIPEECSPSTLQWSGAPAPRSQPPMPFAPYLGQTGICQLAAGGEI